MPNSTESDVTIDAGAFRRVTLAALDLPGVTAAFNTVYQRYVVPFAMDEEQMGRHLSSAALDLAHSPLWLDDQGEVAGLGALGVRGERGWIGGFGLSPTYRGLGLGRLLLDETLACARALGMHQVELEVLRQNEAAIRLYTRAGFRIVAYLAGLVLLRPVAPIPGRETARDADPRTLLARLPMLRLGTYLVAARAVHAGRKRRVGGARSRQPGATGGIPLLSVHALCCRDHGHRRGQRSHGDDARRYTPSPTS